MSECRLWFGSRSLTLGDKSDGGGSGGTYHCLKIPPLCASHLVVSCIDTLKDMLTIEQFNLIHSNYYVMFNTPTDDLPHSASPWSRYELCRGVNYS